MIRLDKKLFICSFFLCVLLATFTINTSLVCNATTQEESTAPEKTLTLLENVVGLNMEAYNTTLDLNTQDLYYESLPQESIKYTLNSDNNNVSVICNFVNNKLRSMSVNAHDSSPLAAQSVNNTALDMAKDFLDKYYAYSSASYYDTLRPMLDDLEADKNLTKTSENMKLEVMTATNCTSFRWTYTANGIEAPLKCVALQFENGFLKYFVDTWHIYNIGSTDLNISEDEAISIAMKAVENYSWDVSMGSDNPSVTVTDFTIVGVSETTTTIGNYVTQNESRGGDPLTLYPGWTIKLYFDKLYSGQVYGLDIGIWADTGEVHDITPMMWTGDYPADENIADTSDTDLNQASMAWIALPLTVVIGAIIGYAKRKNAPHDSRKAPKSRSLKLSAILLCLMISFPIVSLTASTSTVKADTYVMPIYGSTLNITAQEEQQADTIAGSFASKFSTYAGYTTYDYFGSQTTKDDVLDNAEDFEDDYDHVATFHYGHGGYVWVTGVKHWDYFDDEGYEDYRQIRDYMVYPKTDQNKHFFVIIWSCRQADAYPGYTDAYGRAVGMAYAWHHGVDANDCFIGFTGASMPLTQVSEHHNWVTYGYWLNMFAYYLTISHYTIEDALDEASQYYFNLNWENTELYTGFDAVWPDYGTGEGWMKVYGTDDMYVY
ncbi:MAG: hypothetical protein CW691_07660 [Candidatus Bathyarchaeum sp.]|nr:MAG: hypothetical protein CW691_07660 [Candidatus Bathyarchaeum sp.]